MLGKAALLIGVTPSATVTLSCSQFETVVCIVVFKEETVFLLVPRWWRGTVVERRSLAGELSLSCTRPAADG